jgi:DNA-binding transcriptional LysR family regulator
MDLDQLHTFLEIVRLKSFSKAAQTCYRTQPAISAQVRQLEQELNCTLFERLGTRIALTTAGKIFSEYADQILQLRRRAQEVINELERVPRGELVIAANEATCIYVLPSVFSEYKKLFPNVQLHVDDPMVRGWSLRCSTTWRILGSLSCRSRRKSCRW